MDGMQKCQAEKPQHKQTRWAEKGQKNTVEMSPGKSLKKKKNLRQLWEFPRVMGTQSQRGQLEVDDSGERPSGTTRRCTGLRE